MNAVNKISKVGKTSKTNVLSETSNTSVDPASSVTAALLTEITDSAEQARKARRRHTRRRRASLRTTAVSFRVSPQERELITRRAVAVGLPVSTWVRTAALTTSVTSTQVIDGLQYTVTRLLEQLTGVAQMVDALRTRLELIQDNTVHVEGNEGGDRG